MFPSIKQCNEILSGHICFLSQFQSIWKKIFSEGAENYFFHWIHLVTAVQTWHDVSVGTKTEWWGGRSWKGVPGWLGTSAVSCTHNPSPDYHVSLGYKQPLWLPFLSSSILDKCSFFCIVSLETECQCLRLIPPSWWEWKHFGKIFAKMKIWVFFYQNSSKITSQVI